MFSGIILLLTFVVLGLLTKRAIGKNQRGDVTFDTSKILILASVFLFGVLTAIFQPLKLERVDAGSVGIMVKLTGDKRGISKFEYKTGWLVVNTWVERLYEFPTFQQGVDYGEQEVISKGGFPAKIHPTFNYTLNAGNIGDMFQNLRLDVKSVEQGWLKTAIVGAINDVSNRWEVDAIFNHREQFEGEIKTEVNKRIIRWFNVSQLRTNIKPPDALVASITEKTKAIQDVQVAENNKLVAIAQGETRIATARADSAARVIEAAGLAEATKRRVETLTPLYVEFVKWSDVDPTTPRVPSVITNGGSLLNLKQ